MSYTNGLDKPSDYFNTVLRSGLYGGSDTAFTVGFQPDWIWDKRRSDTSVHALFDSVRGFGASGKVLYSNTTEAEATNALIKSVSSTGFTVTASSDNTGTLVDWCWKAGTAFTNDASATGIGSIDSSGSVSTDAGFSIVSYTGSGANATIAHGLGSAPRMMIFKNRDEGAEGWFVYHESIGNTKKLLLDETGAATTSSTFFQDTSPTSSIITLGSNHGCNGPDAMICYAFAEKQGYSKFGSYTGNGNADGSYIHLGFSASLIITKRTDGSDWWGMFDAKRLGHNGTYSPYPLFANTSDAEVTDSKLIDFTANGFKIKSSNGAINASGGSYIFAAFALNPFTTSTEIPTTAR